MPEQTEAPEDDNTEMEPAESIGQYQFFQLTDIIKDLPSFIIYRYVLRFQIGFDYVWISADLEADL